MKKHVVIIHGYKGHREENWFPWIAAHLQAAGYEVDVPQFPTPENQDREHWIEVFSGLEVTEDTIIIAHSLGVPFTLHVLEQQPVQAAFLVAGFTGKLGNDLDAELTGIAQQDFNWEAIRNNCDDITVINSDNDNYVPIEKALELADNLHVKPLIISGAGHFNTASGYGAFPELLELLDI